MVNREQIVEMWLNVAEINYCVQQAKFAEIGGHSNIRSGEDRANKLGIDQLVGQIGQYALSIYLFGEPGQYYIQRMAANLQPTIGDQGQDILGLNVDCKTSLKRNNKDPLTYRLLVRPQERHANWCYILALVHPNDQKKILLTEPIMIQLVGWASDGELPVDCEVSGPFKGAHILKAPHLNPLPNMMWHWRKYEIRSGLEVSDSGVAARQKEMNLQERNIEF